MDGQVIQWNERIRVRRFVSAACVALVLSGSSLLSADEEKGKSDYDKAWARTELYQGDVDSFFQSVRFTGRLQLDLAYVDSRDDEHGEFNVRRLRLGFKTVFLEGFTFHVEGEFNPQEANPLYIRLTDAYLGWNPGSFLRLILGKQSAGFTLEGLTSSKRLLTIDRSNLANNIWFTEEYIPGFSGQGKLGQWSYFAGLFASGGKHPEFGDFRGGEFVLLRLEYDFAEKLGANQALLNMHWVDNEPHLENDWTRDLARIASLNFSYRTDRWGLQGDVSIAEGYFDQSDLWGWVLMPVYQPAERFELVARYTLVESDEPNGVRFPRYERSIADGRGDRYDEIYLGLNYYVYGHELKIQNGLQFAEMQDEANDGGSYRGWAWTTGFRLSW